MLIQCGLGCRSRRYDDASTAVMLLTAVELSFCAVSITPAWCIAAAKLLGDVLPILWEEGEVIVGSKGELLLSRCNAVALASVVATASTATPRQQVVEQAFTPMALGRWFGAMAIRLAETLIPLGASRQGGCQLQEGWVPLGDAIAF